MPKRRSQSHITPHARPRHLARRTAEYITEQWLAQLSGVASQAARSSGASPRCPACERSQARGQQRQATPIAAPQAPYRAPVKERLLA